MKEDKGLYILVSCVNRGLNVEQFSSYTLARQRLEEVFKTKCRAEKDNDNDFGDEWDREIGEDWAYIDGRYDNADYKIFKLK